MTTFYTKTKDLKQGDTINIDSYSSQWGDETPGQVIKVNHDTPGHVVVRYLNLITRDIERGVFDPDERVELIDLD